MINQKINKAIPRALESIQLYLSNDQGTQSQTVPKEYDGYIASFTASVVTAGLLPTLAFFTDIHKMENDEAKEQRAVRRYKITQALQYILVDNSNQIEENALLMGTLQEIYDGDVNDPKTDLDFNTRNQRRERDLEKQIMEAAIALKLAIRNFIPVEVTPENREA